MYTIENVLRQKTKQLVYNHLGEAIACFKQDFHFKEKIYLENLTDNEVLLIIKNGNELINKVLLLPKEIIMVVLKKTEQYNNIIIKEYY